MKRKILFILTLFSIICMSSNCEKSVDDMPFSLNKQSYNGNSLRIDGYYYQKYGNPEKLTIYFFYSNGILLHAGDGYTFDIEDKFTSGQLYEKLKENKYCWGLFLIDGKKIQFERYYNTDELSKKAYIRSGEILNDTTFKITKSVRSDGAEERTRDEMFYFKPFKPKIDSTNRWIK